MCDLVYCRLYSFDQHGYCTMCPDGIHVQCTELKGRDKYVYTGRGAPRLGNKGEE